MCLNGTWTGPAPASLPAPCLSLQVWEAAAFRVLVVLVVLVPQVLLVLLVVLVPQVLLVLLVLQVAHQAAV